MNTNNFKLVSAGIGATAVIVMGVLGLAFSTTSFADPSAATPSPPPNPTGQTVTNTTPPQSPAVSEAKPPLTGPAPLPSEEQGLPG